MYTRCRADPLWENLLASPSCHSECEIQDVTCQLEPLQHIVTVQLSQRCISLQRKTLKPFPPWHEYNCAEEDNWTVTFFFPTGCCLLDMQMSGADPSAFSAHGLPNTLWKQICLSPHLGGRGNLWMLCIFKFWSWRGFFQQPTQNSYRTSDAFQWNVWKRAFHCLDLLF